MGTAEGTEAEKVRVVLPGNEYMYGYNTILGDPEPFFNWGANGRALWYKDVPYFVENVYGDHEMYHEDKKRKSRKAAGLAVGIRSKKNLLVYKDYYRSDFI